MRARLVTVLTIPIVLLFLSLGAAYGVSVANEMQMALYFDRLADATHLANAARQAFGSDAPVGSQRELARYREIYGVPTMLIDRTGSVVATSGLGVQDLHESGREAVRGALAGRPSELPSSLLLGRRALVVAAPVWEGDELAGVLVTASDTDALALATYRRWALLAVLGVVAAALAVAVASRLASWVLRPVREVDRALTEMWQGRMDARIEALQGPPELREVIGAFNDMADEVEQVIQQQQDFVWNASHELRNPLNALLLRVEHLSMGLDDDWSDEIDRTREEGQRLTRILEALLTLARHRRAEGRPEALELRALARDRVAAYAHLARERGTDAEVVDGPAVLGVGDRIALESALDAVLDNALKFTAPGTCVEVEAAADERWARLTVCDHGPGLPHDELARATDRFWRSDRDRRRPGSGLGLAIASEFLASCGGQLRIANADDGGLCIDLEVPVAAEPASVGPVAASTRQGSA